MKKTIKSLALSIVTLSMLAACNGNTKSSAEVILSNETSSLVSSNEPASNSSEIIIPTSSSTSSSSSTNVPKTDIVVNATKTEADLNERILLSSNVSGVTYSTTAGATIDGDVFVATKEGTYVVTAHKEGNYNDGTIIIRASFRKTTAKVKNILKDLKNNQNYTLNFNNLLGAAKLYRTKTYAFNTQEGQGQALLDNNLTSISGSKVSHFIKLVNNKLVVGSAVVYTDTSTGESEVAKNLDEIDAFYDVDVDKLTFTEADGKIYCADRSIKYTVACMLGSISVMFGDELEFDFDDNHNMTIRVMFYDPDTGEIEQEGVDNFGYLTFTNIGTTSAPIVDDALKSLTISNTALSAEVASSFMSTKAHLKTKIKFVAGNAEADLGTSEYHFNEQYLKEDVDSNSQIIHNFYEKNGEDAYKVGIGYNNELRKEATAYWSDFTFPYATFDLSDFRKTGDHTYTYLGDKCPSLANDLAWANIGEENIAYMNATETNGKISSIYCETRNKLYDIGTSSSVYGYGKYVYEIEVIPYENLVAPAPFVADSETATITGLFNEFNKADANYTLKFTDGAATGSYKTIKVTPTTILVEEYLNSSQTRNYRGYHTLPDGVIEFSLVSQGDGYRVKLDRDVDLGGKTLASLLGFNLSPEIVKFTSNSTLAFKDGVFYGGEGLFSDFKYNDYAYDDTMKFTVSSNKISNIHYKWYEADNAWEDVAISNYGTTAFTSEFEKGLLTQLANIRNAGTVSSWQEEDEATYNALLTLLGSENVDLIPYVYNSEYTGKYTGALSSSGTMVSIRLPSSMSYSTEFKTAFIAAAVANGFTDESSGTTYKATKMIGEKRILIQFIGQYSLGITFKVPN